jgi:hypothetical protein
MADEVELLIHEGVGGRSSVYLGEVELGCYPREVRVRCSIWREHVEVPCEVVFVGVLGVKVEELDFSVMGGFARLVEVAGSRWLAECRAPLHNAP